MGFNKHYNQRTMTILASLALLLGSSWFFGEACSDVALKTYSNTPTVTVHIQNYCPLNKYTFRDIFLYNSSAKMVNGGWATDYDRDGISDNVEKELSSQFNISSKYADTNGDYYSDLVVLKMALPPASQSMLPNCSTGYNDRDGDGLDDCEDAYLQLDNQKADTDLDGIPDGIEFRFGLNPRDSNDAYQSIMGDDLTNLDKIKANIPVTAYADDDILKLALQYDINSMANNPNCFDINISNVPILPVSNGNKIMVYATEDTLNNTSGTTILVREVRWLVALVPQDVQDKSTILINDGIHQQVIDGKTIPLTVIPPVGGSR